MTGQPIPGELLSGETAPCGSVLLVDDVETNITATRGILEAYALDIDTAGGGFEAIEKVKSGRVYDIIFMDLLMPELDGTETTRMLREMGYTRAIVALTANTAFGQTAAFLRDGFDDCLYKPIDLYQLDRTLVKFIRNMQTPEAVELAKREAREARELSARGIGVDAAPISRSVMEAFFRDVEKTIEVLRTYSEQPGPLSDTDLRTCLIQIHGAKSALAYTGQRVLAERAKRLDDYHMSGNLTLFRAEMSAFLESLCALVDELLSAYGKTSNPEAAEENTEFLQDRLHVFAAACAEYDTRTAGDALSELRAHPWSRKTRAFIYDLSRLFLHSEFEEAQQAVRSFIEGAEA